MSHKSSNYVILNVISSNHLCVYIFYTVFISTPVMLRKNISSAYDRKQLRSFKIFRISMAHLRFLKQNPVYMTNAYNISIYIGHRLKRRYKTEVQ